MGQRANLLIVSGGSYEMYYTHHRANTLDHDLFWGPDYAVGFIRAQRPVDRSQWLDDVWAEGGAVMDLDRRVLLWFGGEDVMYEVVLRRVHLELMAHLWPGWSVRWADGGVADMADYVGHPRSAVLSERTEPATESRAAVVDVLREGNPDWSETIASIRFASGAVGVKRLRRYCEDIL
jgi:hypothetical protein